MKIYFQTVLLNSCLDPKYDSFVWYLELGPELVMSGTMQSWGGDGDLTQRVTRAGKHVRLEGTPFECT